jgi:hypothetical protein
MTPRQTGRLTVGRNTTGDLNCSFPVLNLEVDLGRDTIRLRYKVHPVNAT